MRYAFTPPGFANQGLAIELSGPFSEPRLLIAGERARRGPGKRTYVIQRDDGTGTLAKLEGAAVFVDPIPRVRIDDTLHEVAPRLRWYEMVACWLPVSLILTGGVLGGVFGGLAVAVNARVFRLGWSSALTWAAVVGVMVGAFAAYVLAALAFELLRD